MSPVAGTPEAASPRAADGSAVPPLASLAKPSSSGDLSSLGDANSDIPWWSVALPLESSGGAASPLFSPLLSPLPGNSGLSGEGFALYGELGRLDGEWDSPEGRRRSDAPAAAAADDDAGGAAVADVTQGAQANGVGGLGEAAGEGWGDEALSSAGSDGHVAAAGAATGISGASDAGSGISGGGVAHSSSAWDGCGNDASSSGAVTLRGVQADVLSNASGGEGSASGRAEEHAEAVCPRGRAAGQAGLAETRQAEGAASDKTGLEQPVVIEVVRVGSGASGGEGEQVGSEVGGEAGAAGLQRRYPSFRVRGHAPSSNAHDSHDLLAPPAMLGAAAGPGGAAAHGGRQGGVGEQKDRPRSSAGVVRLCAGAWRPTAHVDGSPLPAGALSVAAAAETRPKRRHQKAPAAAAVATAAGGASAASPRGAWRSVEARSSRRRRRAQQRRAGARGASGSSGEWDDDFWGTGQGEGRSQGHTGAHGVQGAVEGLPTGVVAPCESSPAAGAAAAGAVDTGSDGRGSAGAAVEAATSPAGPLRCWQAVSLRVPQAALGARRHGCSWRCWWC
ncbi:unnamed protein product [Closterium sp. Yama58-4]|nr:unnamed protein product [Closterium sp. Yama58-4]